MLFFVSLEFVKQQQKLLYFLGTFIYQKKGVIVFCENSQLANNKLEMTLLSADGETLLDICLMAN